MLLLSREDIKKVFTIKDAIEADKKAFQLVAEGKCDAPLRTNIQAPKHDGCFLFMPAYVEDMETASLKIINIFPHNIDNGIPSMLPSFVQEQHRGLLLTCWRRRTAGLAH